jgi:integrase
MSRTDETKPRYFVEKPQQRGTLYYWQPSAALHRAGFKTVSLSRERAEAIRQAEALNAKVDQWRGGLPVAVKNTHGTLPWLFDVYRQSPEYHALRKKSDYEYKFKPLLRWSEKRGHPPMRAFTKFDVQNLWAEMKDTPTMAKQVLGLGSLLWNFADDLDQDIVSRNPFQRMKIKAIPPRKQVWQPEQIEAVIRTALSPGPWGNRQGGTGQRGRPSIALATIIAANTAQRQGDVLALRISQYEGKYITLTQSKTGTTVTIPATAQLKQALDDEIRTSMEARLSATRRRRLGNVVSLDAARDREFVIDENSGRRYAKGTFSRVFRGIARAAGVPDTLQYRDLRRTATVQLAEAGCSDAQIASFGGWSATSVAAMMKIYRPVNVTMADHALIKLEQYRAGKP